MMRVFDDLAAWLTHLESAHVHEIELGLTRVHEVRARLLAAGVLHERYRIITVGGTNGKGSTCAFLEQILRADGYRVACHTSPHVLDFTERARWNGVQAQAAQLLPHFAAVEAARCGTAGEAEISLTYYEFTLLAIMCWFAACAPDVVVLEVGLGGRLDATNIFDADAAIVTSVDIDHVAFLGDTREAIGFEKAGIFRAGRAAICADAQPPQSLLEHAQAIGADVQLIGRDFHYHVVQDEQRRQWRFVGRNTTRNSLAMPAMRGDYQLSNASAALAALDALRDVLPITQQAVRTGLSQAVVRGRFQVLPGQPLTILDVAHNPHAARALAKSIGQMGYAPYTHAVFGAMADKDIKAVFGIMRSVVDHWYLCDLPTPRAANSAKLRAHLLASGFEIDAHHSVQQFESVQQALTHLSTAVPTDDRIIVFGSFVTVENALRGGLLASV